MTLGPTLTKRFNWKCLLCGMNGWVEYVGLDVWFLMHLIEGSHSKANPECDSILGLFPDDGKGSVVEGQY